MIRSCIRPRGTSASLGAAAILVVVYALRDEKRKIHVDHSRFDSLLTPVMDAFTHLQQAFVQPDTFDHARIKRPKTFESLIQNSDTPKREEIEDMPQLLWLYWDPGNFEKVTPSLNRMILKEWPVQNRKWDVMRLSRNDVDRLLPDVNVLLKTTSKTPLERSDLIRISLLAKYGGVWADAALLPLRPLDDYIQQAVSYTGFFCFANESDLNLTSTMFLAARPDNPLVVAWRDAFQKRWLQQDRLGSTELLDTLISVLRSGNKTIGSVWDAMPKVPPEWTRMCRCGCDGFWTLTEKKHRPPVLESPYQCPARSSLSWLLTRSSYNSPSATWVEEYEASLEHQRSVMYSAWFTFSPFAFMAWCVKVSLVLGVGVILSALFQRSKRY
eukprot:TRINITY_DN22696_c0_g3_i1.p1 TRINITY_DN22696_c0_g3~~TRINITY_DN22696_c0_g3_i1.p1  ORF type:complete len:404 (-),score=31.92 TRINITY_DN22696_c0_g3_i1:45-1196(-)